MWIPFSVDQEAKGTLAYENISLICRSLLSVADVPCVPLLCT